MKDHLGGLWRDEDFADCYPRDGRPGLSPAQLATVCVLQFLLGLSNRQAAEAVRCRIDFKYALVMELDDPGFHHSVLSDFRERLTEGGRADRLLDLSLARLKEAGLVRERTTQRTDSTHVSEPATAEIKRMYVTPAARGHGVGRWVLETLERDARQQGMTKAILETGVHNYAALALYTRCGYTPVEPYVLGRRPHDQPGSDEDLEPTAAGPPAQRLAGVAGRGAAPAQIVAAPRAVARARAGPMRRGVRPP
ncbi:GNAT family N-acetyltransferase [Streptomyces sp. NPDC004296]|uniref:GNAT family N-acetyltransferase n=1 Tax=Streptomyces sp. NPDC004296 TaxID=3364697 RepID=UPI0036C1B0A6